LRVIVTATNAGGNASATSAQTAVVLIAAPTNSVLPSITGGGQRQQGVELSAANGTWRIRRASRYQWEQAMVPAMAVCRSGDCYFADLYAGLDRCWEHVGVIVTGTNAAATIPRRAPDRGGADRRADE